MQIPKSDKELEQFLREELLYDITFYNSKNVEVKVAYKDFYLTLLEDRELVSYLQLVSCVNTLDTVHHKIHDCFQDKYGYVDIPFSPALRRKFSSVLFTLTFDYINSKGIVARRNYTETGKGIAKLEELINTPIYFTNPETLVQQHIDYKDFLNEVMFGSSASPLLIDRAIVRGKRNFDSDTQETEIEEDVMWIFYSIYNGSVDRNLYDNETLQFLFSSSGMYSCIAYLEKNVIIEEILPTLYTKIISEKSEFKVSENIRNLCIVLAVLFGLGTIGVIRDGNVSATILGLTLVTALIYLSTRK